MAREPKFAGRKMVALPPDLWAQVEDYRFERRFNTESDALRKLIEVGLKAEKLAEGRAEDGAQV